MHNVIRTAVLTLVVAPLVLCSTAWAGELVELRDGRLVEVENVTPTDTGLVLHIAPETDGMRTEMRVALDEVDAESAARAWGASLRPTDVEGWLRLAGFARKSALFDLAERSFERAADSSTVAEEQLQDYRQARPAEESRHHFEAACDAFRKGRQEDAATFARASIAAHDKGPDAAMARELLELMDTPATPESRRRSRTDAAAARELRKLESFAARGESRLTRTTTGTRASNLSSATRLLGDVSERLAKLTAKRDVDAATLESAAELREKVDGQRVNGLLHLADLALDAGADQISLNAVHEVLSIRPAEPLALDLRTRLLDGADDERERERDVVWSGARRIYHAHPYPARGVTSGIGLVPTWDPIRGLGRIPYTGANWWRGGSYGYPVVRRGQRIE